MEKEVKEEIIRDEEFIVEKMLFGHPVHGKFVYVNTDREAFAFDPNETKFMKSNSEETTVHVKVIKVNNRTSGEAIIKLCAKDVRNISQEYAEFFKKTLEFNSAEVMNKNSESQLENGGIRDFYFSLKVPEYKIAWEQNRFGKHGGCPFFLRKYDNTTCLLQVIGIDDYPMGHQLFVRLPTKSIQADKSEKIELSEGLIHDLLNQGFEWFHNSEMDTLW